MRPRPFGRGIARHARSTGCISGFNEAATFRPRNSMRPRPRPRINLGFNEAATFRPRNVDTVILCRRARPGFNEAATFRPRNLAPGPGVDLSGMASMRPRPFGRGMPGPASAQSTSWSFNEAATFRPRNEPLDQGGVRLDVASMRPRPFGRGMATVTFEATVDGVLQ